MCQFVRVHSLCIVNIIKIRLHRQFSMIFYFCGHVKVDWLRMSLMTEPRSYVRNRSLLVHIVEKQEKLLTYSPIINSNVKLILDGA